MVINLSGSSIIMRYADEEISIVITAYVSYDFCIASIKDISAGKSYMLYDPHGKE